VQALKAWKQYLEVFQKGEYIALESSGQFQENVIAFTKHYENIALVAIAPRFFTSLVEPGNYPMGNQAWQDTSLKLPAGLPSTWQDAITHQTINTGTTLSIAEALQQFPVALLVGRSDR
jgi:(1->4)-alpha-D-glucan 1-alpha-D-glucosylmutase